MLQILDILEKNWINIHVLLLYETSLNYLNVNEEIIFGCQMHYQNRKNSKRCGGIAVHVQNCIKFDLRPSIDTNVGHKLESSFAELILPAEKIIVGEVYRAPNTPEDSFIDDN